MVQPAGLYTDDLNEVLPEGAQITATAGGVGRAPTLWDGLAIGNSGGSMVVEARAAVQALCRRFPIYPIL